MSTTSPDKIRNVALLGHQGCGKTTLAEAALFVCGETTRQGTVEEGNTVSDYSAEEIAHTHSSQTGVLHGTWQGQRVNLLDLPGFADFAAEMLGAMAVADTAALLVSATAKVEVGTEQAWSLAVIRNLPRLFVITKIDRENVDFAAVVGALQDRFGPRAVPLVWPVGEGLAFKGMANVLSGEAFATDARGKTTKIDLPPELAPVLADWKGKVAEAAAEADDTLLEKFFEEGELSPEDVQRGLRKGIAEGTLYPILAVAGPKAVGVSQLLDIIAGLTPSPAERGAWVGAKPGSQDKVELAPDPAAPFSAFVFKTISEPHVGELSIFRVLSGTARPGDDVLNTARDSHERLGQLSILNGKERKDVPSLSAGDIGATVKLKHTHTGDTLCVPKRPVALPKLTFPEPVMCEAISPKSKGDDEKMAAGLARLREEDPGFRIEVDSEIHQTLLFGQGEMQLDVIMAKLKRKFGVEILREAPRIPYRETIRGKAEVNYRHKKQSGGRGQFGEVYLRVAPLVRGGGFEFVDAIVGGSIPGKFVPSVEKGVVEAMTEGAVAGYKIVDVRVELFDGQFHSVDSSDMAFKIAGSMAFKESIQKATPILLEPIYTVEVVVPDHYMGDVMGDLSSRRGKIQGMQPDGPFQRVKAQVPLSELYHYSSDLRSMTQGRGFHSRAYSHYEEVPREAATKIIEEAHKAKAQSR